MKTVKSFKDSGLILREVFLIMLLGTLGASLLGNVLSNKEINKAGYSSKYLQSKEVKEIISYFIKKYISR